MLKRLKAVVSAATKPATQWLARLVSRLEYAMAMRNRRRLFVAWRVSLGAAFIAFSACRATPPNWSLEGVVALLRLLLAVVITLPLWSGATDDWRRWSLVKRRGKTHLFAKLQGFRPMRPARSTRDDA